MTWWQTLIVATVPALVTLVGLLLQLKITNKNEEQRRSADADERKKDREHQMALSKEARRNELDDQWRDERRHTHLKLLSSLNRAYDVAFTEYQQRILFQRGEEVSVYDTPGNGLRPELISELKERLGDVQIVGSELASAAAETAVTALLQFGDEVSWATDSSEATVKRLRSNANQAKQFIIEYRSAIRDDIGTRTLEYDHRDNQAQDR